MRRRWSRIGLIRLVMQCPLMESTGKRRKVNKSLTMCLVPRKVRRCHRSLKSTGASICFFVFGGRLILGCPEAVGIGWDMRGPTTCLIGPVLTTSLRSKRVLMTGIRIWFVIQMSSNVMEKYFTYNGNQFGRHGFGAAVSEFMTEVNYTLNSLGKNEILDHLRACDNFYRYWSKVDLETYARKIFNKSQRFEAVVEGSLVNLISFFDYSRKQSGFISNVSVDPRFFGRGVAKQLLTKCIDYSCQKRIRSLRLEVSSKNQAAQGLYRSFAFEEKEFIQSIVIMHLDLEKNGFEAR